MWRKDKFSGEVTIPRRTCQVCKKEVTLNRQEKLARHRVQIKEPRKVVRKDSPEFKTKNVVCPGSGEAADQSWQRPGFAVLGSDGQDVAVWGVGDTAEKAREDAKRWLDEAEAKKDLPLTETVRITAKQRERIEDGEVGAVALGLVTKAEGARIIRRYTDRSAA